VFSFVFKDNVSAQSAVAFLDALEIFKIGLSWGGVNALAVVYPHVDRPGTDFGGRLVRLNIGLENPRDLIDDLTQALAQVT
jgi:cystathionine beta-lyase